MKVTLLLGAILLMSLVMANDQSKTEDKNKSGPKPTKSIQRYNLQDIWHDRLFTFEEEQEVKKMIDSIYASRPSRSTRPTGIMVSEGRVFFLLPLMWMVIHLLHI